MSQWNSLDGIIQSLKDEADAAELKRKQEAQAALFRSMVPVGPPTQAQASQINSPQSYGPPTKQEAVNHGWQPPQPPASYAVAKPPAFPQVTGPSANTQAPQLSSSQTTAQTVPSAAPVQQVQAVKPQPQFNAPSLKPSPQYMLPAAPPSYQFPSASTWRGAPPTQQPPVGTILPVVQGWQQALPQMGEMARQGYDYLAQNYGLPQLGPIPGIPAAPVPNYTPEDKAAINTAIQQTPAGLAIDLAQQQIAQRHKEKLYTSTAIPDIFNFTPGLTGSKTAAQTGEQALRLGLDVFNLMGLGTNLVGTIPVGNGNTIGSQVAKVLDVGEQVSAVSKRPEFAKESQNYAGRVATLQGINAVAKFFGSPTDVVDPSFFAFLDPKAWENMGNMQTYWGAADTKQQNILKVSPAQGKQNTPEQITYAKNMAQFMMPYSGLDGSAQLFQELLSTPQKISDATSQADALIKEADAAPSDAERTAKLAEAGRLGAQALKLRETTPLDTYNKYWNPRYGLLSEFLMDPMQWFNQFAEASHITPAARRFTAAEKLVELGKDVTPGGNKGASDVAMGVYKAAMQTNRSKSMSDAYTVHDVLTNMLSGLYTKGDIATAMGHVLDDTIRDGIPLAELNGPEQAIAAANGIVPFGRAGVNDFRFQEALKSYKNVLSQIPNLPSLQGEATDLANKHFVQGDILGMLVRSAAQAHGVSLLPEVPFGAKTIELVPSGTGNAIVQWLGEGKQVLGQTAEMGMRQASQLQGKLSKALQSGEEFVKNPARDIAAFERLVISTYGLNPNLGNQIGNFIGGNLAGWINGTALDFTPLEEKMGQMVKWGGGFSPNARVAEGVGGIRPTKVAKAVFGAMPTGTYDTPAGRVLNATTLGLAKAGRELRQGAASIAGIIPYGEEMMTGNINYHGMKSFIEQKWPELVGPVLGDILKGKVADKEALDNIYGRIVNAGIHGNRIDVAREFNNIASGKVGLSLHMLGPYISDALTSDQALEFDKLLANVSPDNLAQVTSRINQVLDERMALLHTDAAKFVDTGPARYFFTTLHDQIDATEAAQQFKVAAKQIGKNPDEANAAAQEVQRLKDTVNQQFLALMQTLHEQPDLTKSFADLWDQVAMREATTRRNIGEGYRTMQEALSQAALPAGAQGPVVNTGEMWAKQYALIRDEWTKHAHDVGQFFEAARNDIASGRPAADIQRNIQAFFGQLPGGGAAINEGDVHTLLSDLSIDPTEAQKWLGQKVGFKGLDPKFESKVANVQAYVRYAKANLATMLSRFPHMESWDEYASAYKSIEAKRSWVLGKISGLQDAVNAAATGGDAEALKRAQGILASGKNKYWDDYWSHTISTLMAGAYRIGELNLPPELRKPLTFSFPNDSQVYKLLGPSLKFPNQWDVEVTDAAGKILHTQFPQATAKIAGVPQAILSTYNDMKRAVDAELWDQIGKFGARAEQTFPAAGTEPLINMQKYQPQAAEIVDTIRKQVASYMSNYQAKRFVPADVPGHYRDTINAGRAALNSILEKVAQANAQGYGKLDLNTLAEFNQKVLPLWDNVMTGAQDYGKKISSISMVDFTNEYHPDVLLSLGAPYHYWWTRMAKNALEAMLTHPRVTATMGEMTRAIEAKNRADNQPNRNIDTLPFGVTVGDTQYRPGMNLLFRWLPVAPAMMASGYSDPEIANQQYEYIKDAGTQQGFPATANKVVSQAIYDYEVAKQLGLSFYSWWDKAVEWGTTGEVPDMHGFLGDISPMYRTMGYGAVRMANWAKDNNIPIAPGLLQAFSTATVPGYTPYLTGREASFEANRGNLGTGAAADAKAKWIQDVAHQDYAGLSPLPEQAFLDPQAAKQYEDLQNKTATEYFIRNLITFITGVPIAASYGPELKLRQAEALKRLSGYDAVNNPQGSQASKYSYTDPTSPNFVQGLAPYESQYAVTSEAAPGQPSSSAPRPGTGAVQTEYYNQQQAIYDKYKAAAQDAYTQHPEWATRQGAKDAKVFNDAQSAAQKQELTDLANAFPTVTNQVKNPNLYAESGARPSEVIQKAQQKLMSMAYANIASLRPPDGATSGQWDAYNKALNDEVTRLMLQPGTALYNDVGNTARDIGRHPKAGGTPPSVLPEGAPQNVGPSAVPTAAPSVPVAATGGGDKFSALEQQYGLPSGLLAAVEAGESGGKADAVSPAGAVGAFQIMPDTWKEWSVKAGVTDPNNEMDSATVAAAYLAWLKTTVPGASDSVEKLMLAYNMGPNNKHAVPASSQAYANTIANTVAQTPQGAQSAPVAAASPATANVTPMPFEGNFPLTQEFGINPQRYKSWGGHMGLDFKMPTGTPVLATQDGTVVDTGSSPAGATPSRPGTGGFGNWIIMQYPDGYTAEYAHLEKQNVKPGDTVSAGTVIGLSDHTGVSDFPHLHFGVRKDGTYINPHLYLDYLKNLGNGGNIASSGQAAPAVGVQPPVPPVQPVAQSAAPPVTGAVSVAPVTSPPASTTGGFPWGITPEQLIAQSRTQNLAPAQAAAQASVTAEFAAIETRAKSTYPKYANLYDEYNALPPEQRHDYTLAHPMIKALHLAGFDPDEFAYLEKTFGTGIVEKWANIPPYTGVPGDDAASKYYHANPDVFLAKSWISGRPQVVDPNATVDPTKPFQYNFGQDYEQAKQLFGPDIWNTVRQYYQTPQYVKGGDNTAWLAFRTDHPEFQTWSAWWYANLPQQAATSAYQPYGGSYHPYSHTNYHQGPSTQPNYVANVAYQGFNPPNFRAPSGGNDWRQFLSLGDALKGWRG